MPTAENTATNDVSTYGKRVQELKNGHIPDYAMSDSDDKDGECSVEFDTNVIDPQLLPTISVPPTSAPMLVVGTADAVSSFELPALPFQWPQPNAEETHVPQASQLPQSTPNVDLIPQTSQLSQSVPVAFMPEADSALSPPIDSSANNAFIFPLRLYKNSSADPDSMASHLYSMSPEEDGEGWSELLLGLKK